MRKAVSVFSVGMAFVLGGCTCAPEPERPLPPPPSGSTQGTPRGTTALHLLDQPIPVRDMPKEVRPRAPKGLPPEFDQTRAARLSPTIKVPKGLGRFGRMRQPRMMHVGQGALALTLGELVVDMPARVYRQGERLVLSAEREDLGVLLVVPSLAAGEYQRGGPPEREPNLRARVGVRGQDQQLQAADSAPGAMFSARLGAITPEGVVTGTFEGQIGRDQGQATRKVSGGRFAARLDVKRAEVESWMRALTAPAGTAPTGIAPAGVAR